MLNLIGVEGLKNLRELNLNNCELSSLKGLERNKNNITLDISGTSIYTEEIEKYTYLCNIKKEY